MKRDEDKTPAGSPEASLTHPHRSISGRCSGLTRGSTAQINPGLELHIAPKHPGHKMLWNRRFARQFYLCTRHVGSPLHTATFAWGDKLVDCSIAPFCSERLNGYTLEVDLKYCLHATVHQLEHWGRLTWRLLKAVYVYMTSSWVGLRAWLDLTQHADNSTGRHQMWHLDPVFLARQTSNFELSFYLRSNGRHWMAWHIQAGVPKYKGKELLKVHHQNIYAFSLIEEGSVV